MTIIIVELCVHFVVKCFHLLFIKVHELLLKLLPNYFKSGEEIFKQLSKKNDNETSTILCSKKGKKIVKNKKNEAKSVGKLQLSTSSENCIEAVLPKTTSKKKRVVHKPKPADGNCSNVKAPLIDDFPDVNWDDAGKIKLHSLIQNALMHLNFLTPTPIQTTALPITLYEKFNEDNNGTSILNDIVGAAETGSGKTLVPLTFVFVVLCCNSLLLRLLFCRYCNQYCVTGPL